MSRIERLAVVLALNLLFVGSLVFVGVTAHSLGVFAAGADYLADAGAIVVSIVAISLSKRPGSAERPNRYPRATTIAALVNGGWLLILCLLVCAGAVVRLAKGTPHVDGLPILVVSGLASIVMVVGALILGGDTETSADTGGELNMRAVLLDTIGDAAAAAGVAVTGAVILLTGRLFWLDPLVALVVALAVGYHAIVLVKDVVQTVRQPPEPASK